MRHLRPLVFSFSAALFLSSGPLHGQASIPDTPAGHALRAWLDAYNSGDSARVAMFFRTYPVEDALRGAFAFRKMTGGLDLLSVQVSEPRHVEFNVPRLTHLNAEQVKSACHLTECECTAKGVFHGVGAEEHRHARGVAAVVRVEPGAERVAGGRVWDGCLTVQRT